MIAIAMMMMVQALHVRQQTRSALATAAGQTGVAQGRLGRRKAGGGMPLLSAAHRRAWFALRHAAKGIQDEAAALLGGFVLCGRRRRLARFVGSGSDRGPLRLCKHGIKVFHIFVETIVVVKLFGWLYCRNVAGPGRVPGR